VFKIIAYQGKILLEEKFMMNEYYIALLGTLFVFFIIQALKNVRRFNLLNKIKKRVLILTTIYLIENHDEFFVKHQYRNFMYRKLEEDKMRKWVDSIDLEWLSKKKLVVSFEMVYNNNVRMRFEYPMDMDELKIRKIVKEKRSV
jgi:hypothetical protein